MPTNVSTSFFFINLLFQARRAGSNPRPSCVPRCVAVRDKSRPWQLAIARAHRENCARARGVAGRGLEKPGILRGAWPHGTSRAHGGGLWPALIKRVAHVRGPVPGFAIRGAWPRGTSRAHGGGLWPALIKRVVHVREVWLVRDWKGLAIEEFGRAQCIWVGQNPRAGWGQGAVLGFPFQAGRSGNSSERDSFLVSFAQKLDAKNTGIPVKQRERHFAVILVG